MPSWKGNKTNPAPNIVRESISLSEKPIEDNRSTHVRRDTDQQKNITIGFYDIDETILEHLKRINLQVTDAGETIQVPVMYGSPELWTSARRDGYLRDKQGKIILPLAVFKRTSSENDATLQYFNRYLHSAVMKKYSTKNKYTKFSLLSGQNAPVNEVYNIVFPSHMIINYHFILWTEYVEQMNILVENIQFSTKDYWGSKNGFKFRTKVESYTHTTELQAGEDRIVKTEFDLVTHGYILPETITTLENQKLTTEKFFTPKKIIIGAEVVSSDFDMSTLDKNREKWRNPDYPNLPKDEIIPKPGITVVDDIEDSSMTATILNTLNSINGGSPLETIDTGTPVCSNTLQIVSPPTNTNGPGNEGQVSYDDKYFYIYSKGLWRRVAIGKFS